MMSSAHLQNNPSEIILALHNIRSAYNVGAILRSAEGFGLKNVILSGYTPRPDDPTLLPHLREKLTHEISKTALGAEKMLHLIYSSGDIISELSSYRTAGYKILGLENNIQDDRLFSLCNPELYPKLGSKIILLLGEEVNGIDYSLYDIIDYFAEIPMRGQKESFNVSVAAGIALFALTTHGYKSKQSVLSHCRS